MTHREREYKRKLPGKSRNFYSRLKLRSLRLVIFIRGDNLGVAGRTGAGYEGTPAGHTGIRAT
jgi:hypothetical protein